MASDQIHLEAAEHSNRVNRINLSLRNNITEISMRSEIAQTIRFFGKNVVKLQECNEAMIKLATIFIYVQDKKMIHWELRDSNAFLLMISTLLLKRKDESVIRQISLIMKKFAVRLSKQDLTSLARLHQKHIQMILHKLGKVETYFTQVKLLEFLIAILKDQNDIERKVIRQEAHAALCSDHMTQEMVRLFHNVDRNNFLKTSRDFLDFYNRNVVKTRFIFTLKGVLMRVNEKQHSQIEEIKVDFNLRNLSISFFIQDKIWKNTRSVGNHTGSQLFVELGECDVAQTQQLNKPNSIELTLRPLRSQILDKSNHLVEGPPIKSLILAVDDAHNVFMSQVYPLLKDKTPMLVDNLTETDSVVSYRTCGRSDVPIEVNITSRSLFSVGKSQLHFEDKMLEVMPDRDKQELKDLPDKKRPTRRTVCTKSSSDDQILSRVTRKRNVQLNQADKNLAVPDPAKWKPKGSKKTVEKKRSAPVEKVDCSILDSTDDEDFVIFPPSKQSKTFNTASKKIFNASSSTVKPLTVQNPGIRDQKKAAHAREILDVQVKHAASHAMPKRVALQEIGASSRVQPAKKLHDKKLLQDKMSLSVSKSKSDENTVPFASHDTEVISENQRPKQQQQLNIVFSMEPALDQNKILRKDISIKPSDELTEDRTKIVRKKSSPKQIRSVQIPKNNLGSPPQMTTRKRLPRRSKSKCFAQLTRSLKSKAAVAIKPFKKQIKDLRISSQCVKTAAIKAKLRTAVASCRESKKDVIVHVHEHVKLLKRLHDSKRKLLQHTDKDKKNITVLKETWKEAIRVTRKTREESLLQIEKIKKSAVLKDKEIRTEVWHKHLNDVSDAVQQMLKKHYVI